MVAQRLRPVAQIPRPISRGWSSATRGISWPKDQPGLPIQFATPRPRQDDGWSWDRRRKGGRSAWLRPL